MGEVSAYLNSEKLELAETKLTPENLAGMIRLIADGTISSKIAKKVFRELITNGGEAQEVVEKMVGCNYLIRTNYCQSLMKFWITTNNLSMISKMEKIVRLAS